MCNRPKRLPTVPLRIEELDIASARQFCDRIHEHHEPPLSGLFALAAWEGLLCVGVAIVGRPVARKFDNGSIAEVTRTATDGVRGACSLLVRAAGREALARGYRRIVSYTLLGETGACYRAARWRPTGITNNPNGWQSRPGRDDDGRQKGAKIRWEWGPDALPRSMEAWKTLLEHAGKVEIPTRERPDAEPLFARR